MNLSPQFKSTKDASKRLTTTGVRQALAEARWVSALGPDAEAHLQAMLTQELGGMEPGETRYAALADDRGHYLADLWVFRIGGDWRLEVPAPICTAVVQRLNLFAVSAQVELVELTPQRGLVHLEGPAIDEWLASVDLPIPTSPAGRLTWRGLVVEWLRRSRYGESGVTLSFPRAAGSELRETLDASELGSAIAEIDESQQRFLRVRAGRPLGGVDVGPEDLLQEAGLRGAISLTKGCYPGQEILQRVSRQGKLRRRLRGLRAESASGFGSGRGVRRTSGEEIGSVRTVAPSPDGAGALALAWIERDVEPGESVRIDADGAAVPGGVEALPFATGSYGPLLDVPSYPDESEESA